MRDGADHLITVEQWIAVGTDAGWDMTKGYLFPHITAGANRVPVRESLFPTAPQMTVLLKHHSVAARKNQSSPCIRSDLGGGFTSVCSERCINHHAESILKEPINGLEIHEAS